MKLLLATLANRFDIPKAPERFDGASGVLGVAITADIE